MSIYACILRQKSYSVAGSPFGGQPIDTNRLSEDDETISWQIEAKLLKPFQVAKDLGCSCKVILGGVDHLRRG